MRIGSVFAVVGSIAWLAGCTTLPSVPGEEQFPVSEILRYTACELKSAYRALNDKRNYPNFHADQYAITVALQPKVDNETTARAGLNGKSSTTNTFLNSWAAGAATGGGSPGAGFDVTAHQDGSAAFIVKSATLLKPDKKLPLDCSNWSDAKHALETNLQVQKWIVDTSGATNKSIGAFTLDKHSFLAQVTIQFDVGGAFTYTFPLGADFATASARRKLDESLTITIVHEEPKKPPLTGVVTLPGDDHKFGTIKQSRAGVASTAISAETKTRLDLFGIQQSLQNIQVAPR
jgi:hypothetical protein